MTTAERTRSSIRLVCRSYMAFVIAPEPPIYEWLATIDERLKASGDFFVGRPVVLDVAAVRLSRSALLHLVAELKQRNVTVIGIENADPAELDPALPPLLQSSRVAGPKEQGAAASGASPAQNGAATLLLDSPVRSGQMVVFPDGDVTVLGSVASGAELVAGGSIHVYGTLRGRAMAGARGNTRARIFCSRIEAELLAISGYYLTAESIDQRLRSCAVQAWLDDDCIMVAPLN